MKLHNSTVLASSSDCVHSSVKNMKRLGQLVAFSEFLPFPRISPIGLWRLWRESLKPHCLKIGCANIKQLLRSLRPFPLLVLVHRLAPLDGVKCLSSWAARLVPIATIISLHRFWQDFTTIFDLKRRNGMLRNVQYIRVNGQSRF